MPQHRPLSLQDRALLEQLAAQAPEQLPMAMQVSLMMGDYETCTYITAKHFDKLPPEVQEALKAAGLKEVSGIMQQMEDMLLGLPETSIPEPAAGIKGTDYLASIGVKSL